MKHKHAEFIRLMANGVRIEASKDSVYWSTAFYWQFDDNSNVWQFRISTNQLPDAEGWIPWHGGENPAVGKIVCIKCRVGGVPVNFASNNLDWRHKESDGDITHYRIVKEKAKKWRWMYTIASNNSIGYLYLTHAMTEAEVKEWGEKRVATTTLGPRQDWTEVCDE